MQLSCPQDGSFYRVVHKPRVAVRAEPSTGAEILAALVLGEVFHVEEELASGWVKLSQEEAWARSIGIGFALIHGGQVGLGQLLEHLSDGAALAQDLWPYSLAVQRAGVLGVPFTMGHNHFRPSQTPRLRHRWLSEWHSAGSAHPVEWLAPGGVAPPLGRPRAAPPPRLCVALLTRGILVGTLVSFARYHFAIGFERVVMFFDVPAHAAAEAEASRQVAALAEEEGRVEAHLCNDAWWREEKRESRFYQRQEHLDKVYREMVELHELVRDVQARQCLALDRALRDAQRDGFDWLLHIDSDEVLLLPQHRDAREFFASVPEDYDQVVFSNLEAVPEQLEVGDWFREVSLFKVHHHLLREDPTEPLDRSERGMRRKERREQARQRKVAAGADMSDFRDNRTFDTLMLGVRNTRRETAFSFDFDLPPVESDDDEEISDGEDDSNNSKKAKPNWDVPSYFTAYSNGKAACRLRRQVPPPLPVGVHRCTSDRNSRLNNLRCGGHGAPVVLHYANCGFAAWRRKYEILSTGHGTEDGGFSVTRRGINSMRAHLAHRDLLRRGDDTQREAYYRTFIMCSEFGELAHFASHGLLTRIDVVREVLGEVLGEAEDGA